MEPLYIVRFDDVCPTMNWDIWDEIESILIDAGVAPLLAVVPDNQDPELQVDPPAKKFWERVRAWQARGWTIALHGYQHRYETRNSGLVRLNNYSEFAGLPETVQSEKIQKGLEIFECEGVRADAWIAPAHSFDEVTMRVLAQCGVKIISDGFARRPFIDRYGFFWIPQQLWGFMPRRNGTWTVCFHCNQWSVAQLDQFRSDLKAYRSVITSVSEVQEYYKARQHCIVDTLHAVLWRKQTMSKNRIVRWLFRLFCR